MRTTKEGTTVCRIFDGLSDLLAEANRVRTNNPSRAMETGNSSFTGRCFLEWQDVEQAVHAVWPEGMQYLGRMSHDLADAALPTPKSRRRRSTFREDTGDELDYDRLRTGQAFWRTCAREVATGPSTITVLVDVGAQADVHHLDILWRGAAAIALTKILEAAGYRVDLWAVNYTKDVYHQSSHPNLFQAICLKAPSDPLDEATLISAVSGWCYRTVIFQSRHGGGHTASADTIGGSYTPKAMHLDHVTRDENRVLVADVWNYRDAVGLIRAKLTAIAGL